MASAAAVGRGVFTRTTGRTLRLLRAGDATGGALRLPGPRLGVAGVVASERQRERR